MVFVRADANEYIGTGHVMRCLAIAHALADKGEQAVFLIADHKAETLIGSNGFRSICLNTEYEDMEGELGKLSAVIKEFEPFLILIDSYYVSEKYLSKLSALTQTAYIDDRNKACWDVDYLINYNIFASVYNYTYYEEKRTKLLLNPEYAPLRSEFRSLPRRKIKDVVTDILISLGGADPENMTELMMNEICPCWKEIDFHFIIGALNPRINRIQGLSEKYGNIFLHINEQKMCELMLECDFAVSAAGSTLYELCACGTPTIAFSLADNQIAAVRRFAEKGIMLEAGDCRENKGVIEDIKDGISMLLSDGKLRRDLSFKSQGLVDGHGAERIADRICLNTH